MTRGALTHVPALAHATGPTPLAHTKQRIAEKMHIGYVLCKGQGLSELGSIYVDTLKKYAPQHP